jgi:hypothetical protein
VLWAPTGVNLAWVTDVPGLALVFAPLTWLAGPIASYDTAAVLAPALSAWTAYLLCRYLTRSLWPSLVGGYLFGFSSYSVAHLIGHLNLVSVFLLPLVALVVLRYVDGELDGRGLVVRLGPLLAFQVTLSTEIAFTLTLALATCLVLGFLFAPALRPRVVSALGPLAGAYALCGALASPLLYYALRDFHDTSINLPQWYTTDLLNVVVPTKILLIGGHWARGVSQHFPGNDTERNAYIGLPALVIVGWFAARRWRTPGGRFLLAGALLAFLASFGQWFEVDGHHLITMPWAHVQYLSPFNNVLPSRLMLYAMLAIAVIAALWTASMTGPIRFVLPMVAALALVPDLHLGFWRTHANLPAFFTNGDVERCISPGENIMILPQASHGNGMLWQAKSGFRFTMADGYVHPTPPPSFTSTAPLYNIAYGKVTWPDLAIYAREKGVTAVLIDAKDSVEWRRILQPLAPPQEVGGVLVYRFDHTTRC